MKLPLSPPVEPMLARAAAAIPAGMWYEPKWDGFRCLVFRDHDEVVLCSRNGRDLSGYFPEVVAAVVANLPQRCVLDGELVVVDGSRLDFVRLTERVHPAASRVLRLAEEWPASFVTWDLLALDQDSWVDRPFTERRAALERTLATAAPPIHLTPLTTDEATARRWFDDFEGAGLDGVIAKQPEGRYLPGQRAMVKVKHSREADVVVAGYRLHSSSTPERQLLGSLQLGLHDEHGVLHFVGASSAFPMATRESLAAELSADLVADDATHPWRSDRPDQRRPGGPSRWGGGAKATFLIDPLRVCSVGYDHLEGLRFRHTARFLRWRPDRTAASCGFDQLDEVVGFELADILGR